MYFELDIKPYQVQDDSILPHNMRDQHGDMKQFPVAFIGRGSYLRETVVIAGIDHINYDCYNLHIGRFCSIHGHNRLIINNNHDYTSVAMGDLSITRGLDKREGLKRRGSLIIENDVSIGYNSMILSGVTIQNGAVILAGSVITKDVPPYAIVEGNPAKIIGYRFTPEQIDKLLNIQWWYWSKEKQENYRKDFCLNIDEFIQKHFQEAEMKEKENIINYSKCKEITLFLPDFESHFPIYNRVIEEYFNSNVGKFQEQFLILIPNSYDVSRNYEKIEKLLEVGHTKAKEIVVKCVCENEVEDYISISDRLVLARGMKTVYYSSMAHKYGVKILSGVDTQIFDS